MQLYTNSIQDRYGNALKGAQITVRTEAGDIATLYSDNGVTLANNPLTADATGEFSFYAANGRYSFTIGATGMQSEIVSAFEMYDALEVQAAVTDGAATATTQAGIATGKAAEALANANAASGHAGTATTQAGIATDKAALTAADRIQTGEDRTATGQDRAATGADRTQTGLDRTAAALSETNSTNSANLAASNTLAQLTAVKTQTLTARDEAIAGLGAADQSQNLVLLAAGLQHALDIAGQAADWPLNVARAEALMAAVCVALDLAGVTAKQVNGGAVQLAAGTLAEPALWPAADRNTGLYFPAADVMALVTAGLERLRVDASGKLGIGTNAPSGLLDVNDNRLRVRTAKTPDTAAAAGNAGEICWDASFLYCCTATNTWKRAALTTW